MLTDEFQEIRKELYALLRDEIRADRRRHARRARRAGVTMMIDIDSDCFLAAAKRAYCCALSP